MCCLDDREKRKSRPTLATHISQLHADGGQLIRRRHCTWLRMHGSSDLASHLYMLTWCYSTSPKSTNRLSAFETRGWVGGSQYHSVLNLSCSRNGCQPLASASTSVAKQNSNMTRIPMVKSPCYSWTRLRAGFSSPQMDTHSSFNGQETKIEG